MRAKNRYIRILRPYNELGQTLKARMADEFYHAFTNIGANVSTIQIDDHSWVHITRLDDETGKKFSVEVTR